MDEQQVQDGQKWLVELLQLSGLPTQVQAELNKVELEESCWLTLDADHALTPEQVQALTGAQGAALDALQYLANTTLNMGRGEGEQLAFTLELSGYRVQRQAELKELSDQAAQRVRKPRKSTKCQHCLRQSDDWCTPTSSLLMIWILTVGGANPIAVWSFVLPSPMLLIHLNSPNSFCLRAEHC